MKYASYHFLSSLPFHPLEQKRRWILTRFLDSCIIVIIISTLNKWAAIMRPRTGCISRGIHGQGLFPVAVKADMQVSGELLPKDPATVLFAGWHAAWEPEASEPQVTDCPLGVSKLISSFQHSCFSVFAHTFFSPRWNPPSQKRTALRNVDNPKPSSFGKMITGH